MENFVELLVMVIEWTVITLGVLIVLCILLGIVTLIYYIRERRKKKS